MTSRVALDIASSIGKPRIIIELFKDQAPKTCENFETLCSGRAVATVSGRKLSYQGSGIHRIVAPEFLIQGGDITGDGNSIGKSIFGGSFEVENVGGSAMVEEGLLCMATEGTSGGGSNQSSDKRSSKAAEPNDDTRKCASQFFITLCSTPWLAETSGVFGKVVKGLEDLKKLGDLEVDEQDRPLEPVTIVWTARLERKQKRKREEKDGKSTEDATEKRHGEEQSIETEHKRMEYAETSSIKKEQPKRSEARFPENFVNSSSSSRARSRSPQSEHGTTYSRTKDYSRKDQDSRRYDGHKEHTVGCNERARHDSSRDAHPKIEPIVFKGRGAMKFRERKKRQERSRTPGRLSYD